MLVWRKKALFSTVRTNLCHASELFSQPSHHPRTLRRRTEDSVGVRTPLSGRESPATPAPPPAGQRLLGLKVNTDLELECTLPELVLGVSWELYLASIKPRLSAPNFLQSCKTKFGMESQGFRLRFISLAIFHYRCRGINWKNGTGNPFHSPLTLPVS